MSADTASVPRPHAAQNNTYSPSAAWRVIGNNGELDDFVRAPLWLTRGWLNLACFCALGFGLFLIYVFALLGKQRLIWRYLVPILICAITGVGIPIALVLVVIAWVHANKIMTRCHSLGKARVAELESISADAITANDLLERGLLKAKIIEDKFLPFPSAQPLPDLAAAIDAPGGNPDLLYLAGVQCRGARQFADAKKLFDLAATTASDETLLKQIQQSQKECERHLR